MTRKRKNRVIELYDAYIRAIATERPADELEQLRRVIKHEERLLESGELQ